MGSDVTNSENAGSSDAGAAEKGSTEISSSATSAEHSSEMAAAAPAEPPKDEIKPSEIKASEPEAAAPKPQPEQESIAASVSHSGTGESGKEPAAMSASAMNMSAMGASAGASTSSASGSDAAKETPKDISAEALKPRPGSSLILIPPVTRKAEGTQAGAGPKVDAASSFTSARSARPSSSPRISKGTLLRYGIPAALGFCLFGVGIATGGQFFGGGSSVSAVTAAAPAPATAGAGKVVHTAAVDQQTAELRRLTKKLTEEVHTLQARVESMHAGPAASSEDIRSLKKSVEALRASFDSQKAETGATIAILSSKVDHLQHEAAARPQTNEHTAHNDKPASPAPATTASVTHPPAAQHAAASVETAMATPASAKAQTTIATPAVEPKKKAEKLLANWVVRDVYRGVALVDGPEGTLEVSRGDPIPGAGTVESIERRNGGWVLVTSRGIVVSARE